MIDTRATFNSILNDPKLDALLLTAQSKIAEYSPEDQTVDEVNQAANNIQEKAAQVRADLQHEINSAIALRHEKVALAVHMFKVASRLSA
jgi:hypothetical protein